MLAPGARKMRNGSICSVMRGLFSLHGSRDGSSFRLLVRPEDWSPVSFWDEFFARTQCGTYLEQLVDACHCHRYLLSEYRAKYVSSISDAQRGIKYRPQCEIVASSWKAVKKFQKAAKLHG